MTYEVGSMHDSDHATFSKNMADASTPVLQTARRLARIHIVIGFLMWAFSIAFCVLSLTSRYQENRPDYTRHCGIWIGIWMCVTGGQGILGMRNGRGVLRMSFMVSVNISILLGAVATSLYTMQFIYLYVLQFEYSKAFKESAVCLVIMIFGHAEFVVGIAASIMCCMIPGSCCCCARIPNQQEQMMVYHSGAVGTVPAQGSYVVPVEEGCEVVTVNTSRDLEQQSAWVPVPHSEGADGKL